MSDVPMDKNIVSGESNIALAYFSPELAGQFLHPTEYRVLPLPSGNRKQ